MRWPVLPILIVAAWILGACSPDEDYPDIRGRTFTGSFRIEESRTDSTHFVECSAQLIVTRQDFQSWTGRLELNRAAWPTCLGGRVETPFPTTSEVSGWVGKSAYDNISCGSPAPTGPVCDPYPLEIEIDDWDFSVGCDSFEGSQVLSGLLLSSLEVSTSFRCDAREVEVQLAPDQAPRFRLGSSVGARLGRTTRVVAQSLGPMRSRFVLGGDAAAAKPRFVEGSAGGP